MEWRIESIETEPGVTLDSWSVYDVPLNGLDQPWTRHFVGTSLRAKRAIVSSPVLVFDVLRGLGQTRTQHVYWLAGRPGADPKAVFAWQQWKIENDIDQERDVTRQISGDLAAARRSAQ